MYPLKFEPFLRPMIWGGEKIAAYKGVETSVRSIGESWELSGVAGHESIVAEGPCKGVSLPELIDRYGEPPRPVLALLDVALLRAAAAKAGVSDITQKQDTLRFTLAVFRPEALVKVCGLAKYKFRLTLSAGETPMLTLKLKPNADVLETALELVEDLKLASQE